MALSEVTDASFENEVLKASEPVLVDFWAEWCAPCRQLIPVLEKLSAQPAIGVRIVKLNVDQNPATAAKYGIRSIPTLVLFRNGQILSTHTGVQPPSALSTWIAASL